jgi:hypothetical protein
LDLGISDFFFRGMRRWRFEELIWLHVPLPGSKELVKLKLRWSLMDESYGRHFFHIFDGALGVHFPHIIRSPLGIINPLQLSLDPLQVLMKFFPLVL